MTNETAPVAVKTATNPFILALLIIGLGALAAAGVAYLMGLDGNLDAQSWVQILAGVGTPATLLWLAVCAILWKPAQRS